MSRAHILGLYRNILRAAANYPSRNAPRIVADVKREFRENASMTDPHKVAAALKEARDGLCQLRMFQAGEGELAKTEMTLEVGNPAFWSEDGPFGNSGGDGEQER